MILKAYSMLPVRSLSLAALLGGSIMMSAADPGSPAGASSTTTASAKGKRPKSDPNEVVCRKEEVLGSRLQSRKICMTRSEWAEATRQQRADVERRQVQRGTAE